MKKQNSLFKTMPHVVSANIGKCHKTFELLNPYREILSEMVRLYDKDFLLGQSLPKYTPLTPLDFNFNTSLSARHVQNAYKMVYESLASWQALLQDKVRELITHSSLNDSLKTILYRINYRKAWYVRELILDWHIDENGNYLVPDKTNKPNFQDFISEEAYRMSLCLIKQARKIISRPNLKKIRTLKLNSTVANLEVKENENNIFNYWLRLSTLDKGNPVLLPLKNNPYFIQQLQNNGTLLKNVQLSFKEDRSLTIAPVIEQPTAELRTSGNVEGLDWNFGSCLFATSSGQLLGIQLVEKLKVLDKQVTELTQKLQKENLSPNPVKLKTVPEYCKLQTKISNYVKNEIGRLLNNLSKQSIQEIVVEKLFFKYGDLSPQMNRICRRAGRKAIETKLSRLKEECGIKVTHVNAAYTSQQCSNCSYIHKQNRNRNTFICRCCGYKLHADINAARNICERRSLMVKLYSNIKERKSLKDRLLEHHFQRCYHSGSCLSTSGNIRSPGTLKHSV